MSHPQFSDDNPKSNPWTEDRLRFTPFAQRLAASISELDAPNGYVIGLQGAWGSGKSTALNFVQAIINKQNDELGDSESKIHVIDFRPWIVSGHQDLIESFFKIVTEHLADQKDAWSKCRRSGLRTLRKNIDPLVDATAAIGGILAPGIGTIGSIGIKLATEAAKKSGAGKLDEWLSEPSLQSAYENLRKRILEHNERFLVIIDDIDRLSQDEIRTIMQMVKTIGRLPQVIYLLAYDRNIVWPALDSGHKSDSGGPNFAEKIIQQEIELPKPTRNALLSLLDAEIGFMTGDIPENSRWHYIVMDGIHHWIKYPRDVARLSNALKFTWPAIEGEVDAQDVLAMEGIRLFEPELFDWIRSNRELMFGFDDFDMATDEGRAKLGESFLSLFPSRTQERIARILCTLAPSMSSIFEKNRIFGLSSESHVKVVNRRGVGSQQGYDAYFSLHVPDTNISTKLLDRALNSKTSREDQLAIMQSIFDRQADPNRPPIGEYFQDLRFRLHESAKGTAPIALLEALFDFSPVLQSIDKDVSVFMLGPQANASLLMSEICRTATAEEIENRLIDLYSSRPNLSFSAEFWAWRARELGLIEIDGQPREKTLSEPLVRKLHKLLVSYIEDAAASNDIDKAPFYFHIAEAWAFEGNESKVRDWISDKSRGDGHFLAKICLGILGHTVGSNSRIYSMNSAPKEKYYAVERLFEAAEIHRNDAKLSEDEKARINTLHRGLKGLIASRQTAIREPLQAGGENDESEA